MGSGLVLQKNFCYKTFANYCYAESDHHQAWGHSSWKWDGGGSPELHENDQLSGQQWSMVLAKIKVINS